MPEVAARDGALLGAAVALVALVAYVAVASGPGAALLLAPAVMAYALGSRLPRAAGLAVTAALAVAVVLVDGDPVPAILVTAGPWALGALVRSRRGLVRRLAERAAELEEEERRLATLTVRQERLRMAADLHHLVGHHLAVVVVQAGAGRLAPDAGDARAEYLAGIRRSAEDALADIARLGDALAPERGDRLAERVTRIVDRVRASGVTASLRGELPHDLPDELEDQAVRIVQEALTNVVKHAPGARVEVQLALDGTRLLVAVDDSGGAAGSDLAGSGSGLGLVALAAETEALGGRLVAGAADGGGWRVRAALPLAPPAVIPVG